MKFAKFVDDIERKETLGRHENLSLGSLLPAHFSLV